MTNSLLLKITHLHNKKSFLFIWVQIILSPLEINKENKYKWKGIDKLQLTLFYGGVYLSISWLEMGPSVIWKWILKCLGLDWSSQRTHIDKKVWHLNVIFVSLPFLLGLEIMYFTYLITYPYFLFYPILTLCLSLVSTK